MRKPARPGNSGNGIGRGLVLLLLAAAPACHTSTGTGTGTGDMTQVGTIDMASADLAPSVDLLLPIITYDGGVPGWRPNYCGSRTCSGATPYCCLATRSSPDWTCVASVEGCAQWIGCLDNEGCPGSHPFCCADHPPNSDCRASCNMSICETDDACPPQHPTCYRRSLDGPGVCQ